MLAFKTVFLPQFANVRPCLLSARPAFPRRFGSEPVPRLRHWSVHSRDRARVGSLRCLQMDTGSLGSERYVSMSSVDASAARESHGVQSSDEQSIDSRAHTEKRLPRDQRHSSSKIRIQGTVPRDYVKRKIVMFVGYDGAHLHGFQRNEGVRTVSDILEEALHKAGAITDDNVGSLSKINWIVAARTDKGVSAVANAISFKACFPKRTTAIGPQADPNYKSTSNKRIEGLKQHELQTLGLDFNTLVQRTNDELPDTIRVHGAAKPTGGFSARLACGGRSYEYLLPADALAESKDLTQLSQILAAYEGTHAFHNFTVGSDHSTPPKQQAYRYITRCTCDSDLMTVTSQDITRQYVRIFVQGQSFMLHQIRKMVALALLIERGTVPADAIALATQRDVLVNIPPAPAVGLFLNSVDYDAYNQRHKDSLMMPIRVEALCDDLEDFKRRVIYPSVLRREHDGDEMEIFFETVTAYPPAFGDVQADAHTKNVTEEVSKSC